MNNALMFSSKRDDWQTPPEVFEPLHAEFNFYRDAAATSRNRKVPFYYGPDHVCEYSRDGLSVDWRIGPVFVNPPYSRGLQAKFIAKAAQEARGGVTVVMLLPARTDTKAYHEHIWDREKHKPRPWVREVRFLKGRVRFVGAPASAPFHSMVVIFQKP